MVFLSHVFSPIIQKLPLNDGPWYSLLYAISNGPIGVSIFFVLSGFLITYLLIKAYKETATIHLKHFYIRRILRIWPLYFTVLCLSFFILPLINYAIEGQLDWGSNVFYHLLFISNFDFIYHGSNYIFQSITWSISVEEQFYLFWPLIFVLFPRKLWIISSCLVLALSMLFRFINADHSIILYNHTFAVLVDFAIGGLTALIIQSSSKVKSIFENCGTKAHLGLFLFASILVIWGSTIFNFHYGLAVSRLFSSISFALIIAAQAFTKSNSILNLGRLKFASKWGKYAYGIYLLHPIVMFLMYCALKVFHLPSPNYIFELFYGLLTFVLTLWLSQLSYNHLESKFLKLKEKYSL